MSKVQKLRTTQAQQTALCDFFEENPEVIRGYKKKPDNVEAVQLKWKKITPTLNSLGPPRNQKAWAKYLCGIKAKLKRKRITWKQREDGSGPLMCNADEFTEIGLRILQVLRNELDEQETDTADTQPFEDHDGLDTTTNDNRTDASDDSFEEPLANKKSATTTTAKENTKDESRPVFVNQNETNDEFDTFGKNIAQQLRTLPLAVALETQETLLSIVRNRRLKYLKKNSWDPLNKNNK